MGDPDAGREAVQRREEQRRDREAGERGAARATAALPAAPLLRHVALLGLRTLAETHGASAQGDSIVSLHYTTRPPKKCKQFPLKQCTHFPLNSISNIHS